MKIGIITYHRALNYGAVLQTYALQQYLKSINVECDVIDYICPFIDNFYKPLKEKPFKNPKGFLKEVLYYPLNKKKKDKFDEFINKFIKLSRQITTIDELEKINDEYDFFITGSDQVWNCKWNGFDKTYFLDFADDVKKYSYAASFGFDEVPEDYKETYKELLSEFQGLSIRERTGQDIINNLLGKQSNVNIDPSCLISKEQWEDISKDYQNSDKYVLVYLLDKSDELIDFAKKIAKEKNLKVKFISDAIKKKYDFEYYGFLSPLEFVALFKNASYVVTNSFHGLMLSVIFEKEFCIQYQKNSGAPNSRLKDFIYNFNLENRLLENIENKNNINYVDIKCNFDAEREKSKSYLLSIVNNCLVPKQKDNCSGCRACEKICPQGAISMEADKEGFWYPVINNDLCVSCKKCVKVCQYFDFENKYETKYPLDFIAGYNNDEQVRAKSRSGGVYVALTDYILNNDGVVYGASLMPDMTVCHTKAVSKSERNSHCGSKYVQSNVNDTFLNVHNDLNDGKYVLYSGTSCQIAGLLLFLKEKNNKYYQNNLYTVDIVCHGVVSPMAWQDNIKEIEKKHGNKIVDANFRDKSFGWDSHIESYLTSNKDTLTSRRYTAVFYSHNALRPSCYECLFASLNRISDITLADAWGVKKDKPQWDASKGVSFVMINTAKAKSLVDSVSNDLTYESVDVNNYQQPNFNRPTLKPANRSAFWSEYDSNGYSAIADKSIKEYTKIENTNKMKSKIVKLLRLLHLK